MAVSRGLCPAINHWACPQLDLALVWRLKSGTQTKPAPRAGLTLKVSQPLPFAPEAPQGWGDPAFPSHLHTACGGQPASTPGHPHGSTSSMQGAARPARLVRRCQGESPGSRCSPPWKPGSVVGTSKAPPSIQQAENTRTQGAGPAGFAHLHPLFFLGLP